MIIIYEWMLRIFGWNTFVVNQPDALRQQASVFQKMFNTMGVTSAVLTLILGTVLFASFYYFYWNKYSSYKFKYRYRLKWWFMFLFLTAILVSILTYVVVPLVLNSQFNTNAYVALSLCNFLYSILVFVFYSFIVVYFLGKHTNASCTPFKF